MSALLIAQLEAASKLADHADKASDRWLFFFALSIILIGGLWLIRYFIKALENQQLEYSKFAGTIYTENVKLIAQTLVVLQDNNAALKKLNDWLARKEP